MLNSMRAGSFHTLRVEKKQLKWWFQWFHSFGEDC
jgi:hypothetical protein